MLPLTEGRVYHEALSRCGANSTFVTLAGAGHEDPAFDSAANLAITAGFLRATLTG
jgi:hypothetical protein